MKTEMNLSKETQTLLWSCLPPQERRRQRVCYLTGDLESNLLLQLFGQHNLETGEEPPEMIHVRKEEIDDLNSTLPKTFPRETSIQIQKALQYLLGDGFEYNLGDKVMFNGRIYKITARENNSGRIRYAIDLPGNENKCIFEKYNLTPYTKPETRDMKEKELDIFELLQDCSDVKTIYSVAHDAEVEFKLANRYISLIGLDFYSNGSIYDVAGRCMLYPSRALYEKYPLDAYSAWMEWQEARKPKRWRAEKGESYWFFDRTYYTPYQQEENGDIEDELMYDAYNYFRTEEEAQQAAEVVKEALLRFHENNTEK